MTEEEAKTKACFRAATFGASQQLADGPSPHCIVSACMAWRTRPTSGPRFAVILDDRPEEIWNWDPIEVGHYVGRVTVRRLDADRDGYCGLAGEAA